MLRPSLRSFQSALAHPAPGAAPAARHSRLRGACWGFNAHSTGAGGVGLVALRLRWGRIDLPDDAACAVGVAAVGAR